MNLPFPRIVMEFKDQTGRAECRGLGLDPILDITSLSFKSPSTCGAGTLKSSCEPQTCLHSGEEKELKLQDSSSIPKPGGRGGEGKTGKGRRERLSKLLPKHGKMGDRGGGGIASCRGGRCETASPLLLMGWLRSTAKLMVPLS